MDLKIRGETVESVVVRSDREKARRGNSSKDDNEHGGWRRRYRDATSKKAGRQRQTQSQARPQIVTGYDLRERGAQTTNHSNKCGSRTR